MHRSLHDIPRGRGLGGSHAINEMAFLRGHHSDFDGWACAGNPGWSFEEVLPYFKRMEDVPDGDPYYRGGGGPLGRRANRDSSPPDIGVCRSLPARGIYCARASTVASDA